MEPCRISAEKYIKEKYGACPEYLWQSDPNSCVFRHTDNRKWFAIIMVIPKNKLGLSGNERAEIINLRMSDVFSAELYAQRDGIFPAYHMAKGTAWITVILDGTVPAEDIFTLIDESYGETMEKRRKNAVRPPKEWLAPANPKYYDIEADFAVRDVIEWKQAPQMRVGDTVYMYVGAPVSAILYKCTVVEVGIPYKGHNKNVNIKSLMRIRLERRYERDCFTFERLGREFGIFAVRGPRGVPNSLSAALSL